MRAQLKMFETVGVLVVFFFLLVTAGAFYFGLQKKSLADEHVTAANTLGLQTALRVLYLPELECSFLGTIRENCIDVMKLDAFSNLLEDDDVREAYFSGLGFSSVRVRQAWPCPGRLCAGAVLYNNPVNASVAPATLTPVLLFDPWRDEFAFGVVEVVVYVP